MSGLKESEFSWIQDFAEDFILIHKIFCILKILEKTQNYLNCSFWRMIEFLID